MHEISVKRINPQLPCAKLKVDFKSIEFIAIADMHYGNAAYVEEEAIFVRDYIKNTPNCFCIGVGDYIENQITFGKFESAITPQMQLEYISEFFKPIADKTITLLNGNHELRTFKATGIDIVNNIARELNIPYTGEDCFGFIAGNKKAYTFYAVHSKIASKTEGLAVNVSERDIEKFIRTDILIRAHNHYNNATILQEIKVDSKNCAVIRYNVCHLLPGHYLNWPTYIRRKPSRPIPTGTRVLTLNMDQHCDKIIKDRRLSNF